MHTLRTARDVASGVCAATLLIATPLVAQTSTQLALFGGVATDQLGRRANAVGLAPSLMFAPSANLSAQLGGSVTRFATDAWSLAGSASFDGREALAPHVALALHGGTNASRLQGSASGTYIEGELRPALEVSVSGITVFGGGRLLGGSATQQAGGAGGLLTGPLQATRVTRSGGGYLLGAVANLVSANEHSLAFSARVDQARVADVTFTDRTLGAVLVSNGVSLSAGAGMRSAPDERERWAAATLLLPVGRAAALEVGGGRYAGNRVLGTPGGQFMSLGLSLRLGRGDQELPRPSGVERPRPGMTRLTIRAPAARRVELAGDFTNWKTMPARRAPNGVWYADVRIPSGRYRYAFRVDGDWRVPDGATAVDDGFGGKSAVLVLP